MPDIVRIHISISFIFEFFCLLQQTHVSVAVLWLVVLSALKSYRVFVSTTAKAAESAAASIITLT